VSYPFGERLTCADQASLAEKARLFASELKKGDVCLLYGPIGAGKTFFTSQVYEALGGKKQYVGSPTFTLVNVYPLNDEQIYHVDLYRLEGVIEQDDISQDLWMDPVNGISFIEWAERLGAWLPERGFSIALDHLESGRSILIDKL